MKPGALMRKQRDVIRHAFNPGDNARPSVQRMVRRPFALFAGETYYPAPGWQGHRGQYATLKEATAIGKELAKEKYTWWQVVDLRKLKIVAGEGAGHTGLLGMCPAANTKLTDRE